MKIKNEIWLYAIALGLGDSAFSYACGKEIIYEEQPSKFLTEDLVMLIDRNMSFSHGDTVVSLDGDRKYRVSLFGNPGNNNHVLFENNKLGVSSTKAMFDSIGSLIFRNHSYHGIEADGKDFGAQALGLEMKNINYLEFSNNTSPTAGAAICIQYGSGVFHGIGKLLLNNNHGAANGGAVFSTGDLLFYNIGFFQANNNILGGPGTNWAESGGVLGVSNGSFSSATRFINNGDMEFIGNKAIASGYYSHCGGGAIHARCELSFLGNGNIVFLDNVADNRLTEGPINIPTTGGAIFVNNYVYLDPDKGDPNSHRVDLSADRGNIEFRGNRIYSRVYEDDLPRMNSVSARAHEINVRAQAGHEVAFYDPVEFTILLAHGAGNEEELLKGVYFNAPEKNAEINTRVYGGQSPGFYGTIRFSGKYTEEVIKQGSEESAEKFAERLFESRYSSIDGNLSMENGDLVIEHRAILGIIGDNLDLSTYAPADIDAGITYTDKEHDSRKYRFNKGRIQLTTGGLLMGPDITFNKEVIFRTDGTGHIVAKQLDWSGGAIFDFDYSVHNSTTAMWSSGSALYAVIPNGVEVYANSLTLGNNLMVADDKRTYADKAWKGNKKFLVLSDVSGSRGDTDFEKISSSITGSAVVDSPYAYKGTWSLEWEGNDLYALWTQPEEGGDIEDIDPELAGELTQNSLWMSSNNMQTLSRAIRKQSGTWRLQDKKRCNFWVTGLGGFINQSNKGKADGFDYNGGGYAVGFDTKVCSSSLMGGISFGQIAGTGKNRRMGGTTDQNSLMGQLYGGYMKDMGERASLGVFGILGYGRSHNKLNSFFSSGAQTYADWNNDTYLVDIVLTFDYKWNDNLTLSPFLGLEYSRSSHGNFTEWGVNDYLRSFGSSGMSYLRMPVGFTLKHLIQARSGSFWLNSLSVSYLPDVYRDNPDGSAMTLINDFQWNVQSANPVRNAVRVELDSYYKINADWGVFAGYAVEARDRSTVHQVNLGVNYSF